MKMILRIFFYIVLFSNYGYSEKIVTSFDIARWYLDADLVIVCSVNKTDTIPISANSYLKHDNLKTEYTVIKECYRIAIDSVIKNNHVLNDRPTIISTPEFKINYTESKQVSKEFIGFNSDGDSIFSGVINVSGTNCDDSSYFRIRSHSKYLVILSKYDSDYIIDYATKVDQYILQLINEVKIKGENYFP